MSELLIRASATDEKLLRTLYQPPGGRLAEPLPDRIVIPARIAARSGIPALARAVGLPLLIDPQTHLWQDSVTPGYDWNALPFAHAPRLDTTDFTARTVSTAVASCISFQIDHGASAVIAPGVHVEKADDGWLDVQTRLIDASRDHLDRQSIRLPLLVPVQVGWRLLDRNRWTEAVQPLLTTARNSGAAEILLAAAKVEQGVTAHDRLAALLATIAHARRTAPVVAWHQGELGEVCVAAGALGYETGIGWQEHCDLRTEAANHRNATEEAPHLGARPIYLHPLRRSVPATSARRVLELSRELRDRIACPEPGCCPDGTRALEHDNRTHTVRTRARSLALLDSSDSARWQWGHLARDLERGLDLAERVNRIADIHPEVKHLKTAGLTAMLDQATVLRDAHRRLAA